ncbi:hypothetical protein TMEN_3948 [Trichophyton mentagrophytes]|uniref:Uncharacterized protein n=2 Tax=Trichophyton interdigitale TaxID=101480 RepID=A0A9P4YE69_9EURO|nr:hypothetical protein H101_03305 [Trichophyton interdigitale H6]KAF3893337.1 hypothetical protein GY632_4257 [Trichophyton interdigitale]KDB26761.1 hypothetical protein H109_01438 [Trichophyton interdigitale MR816]GBF61449.1 hypothetical protein TMEN_3948 [Trichophyton mentagrophytes]KAF3896416.1 hypothetical protein GY631_2094 [Trichophyton interdigitale]
MPVVWDDKADALLLASILATASAKVDNAAVAKMMGGEYNALAIKNRIARIKLKAKAPGSDTETPANTPQKPKAARPAAEKKRKVKDETETEQSETADKQTPKKGRRAVKAEVKDEVKEEVKEEEAC